MGGHRALRGSLHRGRNPARTVRYGYQSATTAVVFLPAAISDRVGRIEGMIFTTKAEYGVRLLVELGRHGQVTSPSR